MNPTYMTDEEYKELLKEHGDLFISFLTGKDKREK